MQEIMFSALIGLLFGCVYAWFMSISRGDE